MSDFPTQKITIYHKNNQNKWERYVIEASYRDTSITNHNRNGSNSTDNVLIRIFDVKEYNSKWFVEKDDIIINKEVTLSQKLTDFISGLSGSTCDLLPEESFDFEKLYHLFQTE